MVDEGDAHDPAISPVSRTASGVEREESVVPRLRPVDRLPRTGSGHFCNTVITESIRRAFPRARGRLT